MPSGSTEDIARGLPEGEHMLHCLSLPETADPMGGTEFRLISVMTLVFFLRILPYRLMIVTSAYDSNVWSFGRVLPACSIPLASPVCSRMYQ